MSIQKEVSIQQEKEVAKILNGHLVPASGGTRYDAGDVDAGNFLIECKNVTKPQTSISVKKAWLDKINEQAFEQGKSHSALAFRFEPDGKDYVVLDITTFRDLIENYKEEM